MFLQRSAFVAARRIVARPVATRTFVASVVRRESKELRQACSIGTRQLTCKHCRRSKQDRPCAGTEGYEDKEVRGYGIRDTMAAEALRK